MIEVYFSLVTLNYKANSVYSKEISNNKYKVWKNTLKIKHKLDKQFIKIKLIT
jgi:hypothetical protein